MNLTRLGNALLDVVKHPSDIAESDCDKEA